MLNKKVFYTDSNYDFFVGIVKEENELNYVVFRRLKGVWVSDEVSFHNVYELTLNNIKTLESKRFTLIKEKTKNIKTSINEINKKIVSLSNKICTLSQENRINESYHVNKEIEELKNEKTRQEQLLQKFTKNYIDIMQDKVFSKRIEIIKSSLS